MAVRINATNEAYTATTGLPTTGTAYSFTAWFYLANDRGAYSTVLQVRQSSGSLGQPSFYFGTKADGNTMQFSTNSAAEVNGVVMTTGQWYKIAFVRSGTSVSMYTAALASTLTKVTSASVSGMPSSIAMIELGSDESDNYIDGRLAGVKMWNAALSDAEITAEFQAFEPARTANLLRYSRFLTATNVIDAGSGGNWTNGAGTATTEADPPGVPESLVTTVDLTDAGTGDQTVTVDQTEIRSLTDAGVGTDTGVTFADFDALTDTATATETIAVDQLGLVSISDSGVGTDTLDRIDFVGNDLVETGTGTEAIDLVQTNFVDLVETGVGTDAITIEQQLNVLTDTGTGTDDLVGLAIPFIDDSGVGTEEVSVVVIPFTAIQPLVEGTIYDLVVVARVPQVSGPPTFIEVDPIEWKSLTYSNTLKEPQELSASCLITSVPESIWQRLRALHEQATELWLYRDGERVFAGPLQGWQTSGEDLQLSCKGLMQYLRSMVVNSDLVFTSVDQSTIVKTLVDQWQNLSYGNFGIDTSKITPSGQLRTITYLRNELHVVGARIEDLGKLSTGFDAEIDPATRELLLWSPTKGVDRATGEDAIIFDARNITSGDILCSVAGGDLASEAYGNAGSAGSDEALFSIVFNEELRARYGRTGVTGSWSNEKEQAALDAYVQGLLDARSQALMIPGPKCRVTPDADLSSYSVGDWIAYDLAEQLGINSAFRIRKQTVTVSSTGQESVDLEFV